MQLSKFKFLFAIAFIGVFSLIFTSAVYSDSQNGWKGYGLYNLSNSKIEVLQEDSSIEIENNKLQYNGEFVIKNTTNAETRVTLGVSASGVEKISMQDKGSYVKWKKRSIESLQNEYKLENQLPQENYWYVFNITLNPAETRIINVNINAVQLLDEQGTYTISYFGDRKMGFPNNAEKSSLYIEMNGFESYNILSLKGLNPTDISKKGEILVQTDESNMEAITIKYKNVEQQAVDKLLKSPMQKVREIALTYSDKNYEKVTALCDAYMKNPSDKDISSEQIQFIKAESLRKLNKLDKYLELAETIDYSRLYPAELRNKIYLDRLDIYIEQQSQDKIDNLSKELYLLSEESTEFLTAWMEDHGYFDISEPVSEDLNENKAEVQSSGQTAEIIKKWYGQIISMPYTPLAIFLFGLVLGLLLRKPPRSRRRRSSRYIYRM